VGQAAVINVRVQGGLSDARLVALRDRLPAECGLTADDFYTGGPLTPEPDEWAMPVPDPASRWYRANLYRAFWSPSYPRGNPPVLARVAAWLEANVPGGEVWYGSDFSDHLQPFGPAERAELLALWHGCSPDAEPGAAADGRGMSAFRDV
jgi:hypothetical protein